MPPQRICEALTTGPMKNMAEDLSDADKPLLAEFTGRKLDFSDFGDARNMKNVCTVIRPCANLAAPSWNSWGDFGATCPILDRNLPATPAYPPRRRCGSN